MRVLLVTNDYPPRIGGIERYLSGLVGNFRGEVRVLAPLAEQAPPDPLVVRGHRGYLWPTRRTRRWIVSQIEEFAPDVVAYGAPWPLALLGPGIAGATGVPYAVLVYGADLTVPLAVPGFRRVVARPLRGASVVMALSRYTEQRAARITARPVVYLGSGVDLDRFQPGEPPERFVVGCVGRFVERKGHHRLLAAAEELHRLEIPVEVILVGKGPGEARLRSRAAASAVAVRLEVGVDRDRIPALYAEMSAFAMPVRSKWLGLEVEGLGLVYLEAAASGLPVVAGASGGAPETVAPGQTGFVVHSQDHLVEALRILAERPELARRMGRSGRERVAEAFAWPQVIDRFEEGLRLAVSAGVVPSGE